MSTQPASTVEERAICRSGEWFRKISRGAVPSEITQREHDYELGYLAAAQAERPYIEIEALEQAAKMVCPLCDNGVELKFRDVCLFSGKIEKHWTHGQKYCLTEEIHHNLARLRATLEQNGGKDE